MAVKFSQFSNISPSATTFLVGYDGADNIQIPYSSLVGGSGTTNYLSKWTGSTALGNSLVYDDGTSVGVNTATPSATYKLDISGATRILDGTPSIIVDNAQTWNVDINGLFKLRNGGTIYSQISAGSLTFPNGGVFNSSISFSANKITTLSGVLAFSMGTAGGTERMRLTNSGRLLIGTTTESTYELDVNGTTRISGTELRLDNGTTGTLNIYSATPEIRFAAGDPTGYRIYRSGTNMFWNSSNIALQISGNDGYSLSAANGHIWRTANSGGAALARLDTGGSLSIGKGTATAVASSILELSSTTKGFLPPRMTTAQRNAISSPAAGLMVFDTNTGKVSVFDGSVWQYLAY